MKYHTHVYVVVMYVSVGKAEDNRKRGGKVFPFRVTKTMQGHSFNTNFWEKPISPPSLKGETFTVLSHFISSSFII